MTTPPSITPITPAILQILLAVAGGSRHGYGIMREVSERTRGAAELGAGTLYRSIKRMLAAGWIEEIRADEPNPLGPARREYRITDSGRRIVQGEIRQLHGLVEWARATDLVDPGETA